MDENLVISGLDIGSASITACIGSVEKSGNLSIIGLGSCRSDGIKNGVVSNIESIKNCVKEAIDQAELMAGIVVEDLYLSISGPHIRGLNSPGVIAISNKSRIVGEEDVKRVIDQAKAVVIPADHEIIHVLSRVFSVDEQTGIKDPVGMTGIRLGGEVHIITGLVSAIQNLIKVVSEKGYGVADIVFSPLASSDVILSNDEKELGITFIDIGGGTTDILIYAEGGVAFSHSIPLAGFHITNDISIGLRTPVPAAEDIKLKYGCANPDLVDSAEYIHVPSVGGRSEKRLYRQELCQIIEPRVEEIFELIDEKIIQSGLKGYLSAGAVVTGGTMLLEGTADIAERVLNLPVRIGMPEKIFGLKDFAKDPSLSTAVGLVSYGYKHQKWRNMVENQRSSGLIRRFSSKVRRFFEENI